MSTKRLPSGSVRRQRPHLAPAAEVAADHVDGDQVRHAAHVDARTLAVLRGQSRLVATGRAHLRTVHRECLDDLNSADRSGDKFRASGCRACLGKGDARHKYSCEALTRLQLRAGLCGCPEHDCGT